MQRGDLVYIALSDLSESEQEDLLRDHGPLWVVQERTKWFHDGEKGVQVRIDVPEDAVPEDANWLWWCTALSTGAREHWYECEMKKEQTDDAIDA